MGSRKMEQINQLVGKGRDADVKNRQVDMVVGERRVGQTESSIDTYKLPCVK